MAVRSGPKIGVLLPNTGRGASRSSISQFARLAEDIGVDSLWVGDHISLPGEQDSGYPYVQGETASYEVPASLPFLEAFTTLGFAAAVTSKCRLGLGVGILPYRHPLLWAKAVGSVQILSEGRLDFGVGVGWMREEFDALGAPFERRGALADEILEILRNLPTAPQPVSHRGEFFTIEEMFVNPSSRFPEPSPVWVGGTGKASETRTARYGDVWYPHVFGVSPEAVAVRLPELRARARQEFDRAVELRCAIHMPLALQDQREGDPWETGTLTGPAGFVADVLLQYADVGVEHVTLTFGGGPQTRMRVIEGIFAELG